MTAFSGFRNLRYYIEQNSIGDIVAGKSWWQLQLLMQTEWACEEADRRGVQAVKRVARECVA